MVDIRATGHAATNKAGGAGAGAAETVPIRGSRNGETVVALKDAVALADELKEEIGAAVEDDAEDEMAREDRRVSVDKRAAMAEVAEAQLEADQLADVLQRRDDITAMARSVQELPTKDPAHILHYVRENLGDRKGERGPSRDSTAQYGALAAIKKALKSAGDEATAAAVEQAAELLLAEHGPEIAKGLIITDAASDYASDDDEGGDAAGKTTISDLRALYMDEVVAHKGIAASFNSIVEKYGAQGFANAVGFLLRAAGDDLATMTRDMDRAQQKEILDNLYQLEVLNTLLERANTLLGRLGKTYPLETEASAQSVLRGALSLLETPARISESAVTSLARATVPEPVEGRIAFLREFRSLATLIPLKVFDQADGSGGVRLRERLTDAIAQAQDVADAEEQHKLASQ